MSIYKNSLLKNIWADKNVHVLGLGLSLNNIDPKKIQDDIVICVNEFHKNSFANQIKPRFHILADPLYFTNPKDFLYPIKNNIQSYKNHTNFLMPFNYKAVVEEHIFDGEFISTWYFDFNHDPYEKYSFNLNRKIKPISQNSINMAIVLGLYSGAKNIYLHGVDHEYFSMTKDEYDDGYLMWPHSYDDPNEPRKVLKDWFEKNGLNWEYAQSAFSIMKEQYAALEELANQNGQKIYNCNPNSHLRIFEIGGGNYQKTNFI